MERTLVKAATRRRRIARAAEPGMVVLCETLELSTHDAPEFVDITDEVVATVAESGIRLGQATVFSTHTTAAIKINENEPLLLGDLSRLLREVAPVHGAYEHNDFSRRTVNLDDDECANGHAHCQHLFLSASETIPIVEGQLTLGQWQRIFLVELDRPRQRRVLVNLIGTSAGANG